jgi:hypothetical protein
MLPKAIFGDLVEEKGRESSKKEGIFGRPPVSQQVMLAAAFGLQPSKKEAWAAMLQVKWQELDRGDNNKLDECWQEGADFVLPGPVEVDGRGAKKGSEASKAASRERDRRMSQLRQRLAAARNGKKGDAWLATCAGTTGSELVDSPKASREGGALPKAKHTPVGAQQSAAEQPARKSPRRLEHVLIDAAAADEAMDDELDSLEVLAARALAGETYLPGEDWTSILDGLEEYMSIADYISGRLADEWKARVERLLASPDASLHSMRLLVAQGHGLRIEEMCMMFDRTGVIERSNSYEAESDEQDAFWRKIVKGMQDVDDLEDEEFQIRVSVRRHVLEQARVELADDGLPVYNNVVATSTITPTSDSDSDSAYEVAVPIRRTNSQM